MPKILINEQDQTFPGTIGSYANYSVLLTGFVGTASTESDANIIVPDSNGVYEFTSAEAFKDTIGLSAPKVSKLLDGGTAYSAYHYGNQMAYELLKLGYPIIYKPILMEEQETPAESINKMTEASFWEIFKDKASYDFRFITHGLLSAADGDSASISTARNRLAVVEEAIAKLKTIYETALAAVSETSTNYDLELYNKIEELYSEALETNTVIFTNAEGQTYLTYHNNEDENITGADVGTQTEASLLRATIENLKKAEVNTSTINKANGCIANLAKYVANDKGVPDINTGRGDCIALIELNENKYLNSGSTEKPENLIINAINEMSDIMEDNGKYCALTVPSVVYKMTKEADFDNNTKLPGAFHYLACFIKSLNAGFAEWYAAAGYTRGTSDYTVDYTTVKLGEIAINALEPRNKVDEASPKFACNVIANFRGSYYLWGNRTAHPLGDANSMDRNDLVASHFLNIRQLCTTIKKQLYVACRRFTFDPNSDTLWFNFVNAIKPTLEAMKADQGIRDYKVLKVPTDKKATLKARIRIIPIEAIEDFDLEIYLEDSFGETTAIVND